MAPAGDPLGHQAAELEHELQESLLSPSESGAQSSNEMGNRYVQKAEARKTDSLAAMVALGSVAALIVVSWFAVLAQNPTALGWFAFHPLLQTLSLGLFTYGIVTLQTTSQSNPQAKAAGLVRHQGAIIGLGVPSIIFGSWAIWHNKNLHGHSHHFATWHGTFGAIALVWMVGQVSLGAGSVWFGGKLFGGSSKAKSLWKYHRISGYFLFPLLLLTAHLGGAWSNWATKSIGWLVRFLAYTVAPILLISALYARARISKMKFW